MCAKNLVLRTRATLGILTFQCVRWVRVTAYYEPGQGRETAAIRSLCRVPVPIERTVFRLGAPEAFFERFDQGSYRIWALSNSLCSSCAIPDRLLRHRLPQGLLQHMVLCFSSSLSRRANIFALLGVAWAAAILGDQCNFFIGHFLGRRIIESGKVKAMTPERIAKSEAFLDKWGNLAIFLGRFFPFIRTFVPFLAGMGGMKWHSFVMFNILGGVTWSTVFVLLGYFFGGIPFVQEHFELLIIGIVAVSLVPTIVGLVKGRLKKA